MSRLLNHSRRAALSTMFLAVAATEIEMTPLQCLLQAENIPCLTLVTGVGPIETAVRLSGFLAGRSNTVTAVVNLGVAGGYVSPQGQEGPELLDLYLAETESFGDLGICFPDRTEPLPEDLAGKTTFSMDRDLLTRTMNICVERGLGVKIGSFVTVAGASATQVRGEMLRGRFKACCENMEGAAVARACVEYSLPVLEIRCISNLVENRDPGSWRLQEACEKAAQAAAVIIQTLVEQP